MTWIDTHCHLDQPVLSKDIQKVIKLSKECNIEGIVVPSTCPSNIDEVIKICNRFDMCFFALGFHPFFAQNISEDDLKKLSFLLIEHDAIAVGEIGLGKFSGKSQLNIQDEVFQAQLDLAEKHDLPIIVHARGMIDRATQLIRKRKIKGGIIHAFNGSFQQADQLIKLGFKLGFGGVISYERAKHIRSLAQNLPLESIVLETDSPDMKPAWVENGCSNEPAQLEKISQVLCHLRGIDARELGGILKQNTIEALPKLSKLYT